MNIGHGAGRRPAGRLGIVAATVAVALLGSGCDDGSSDVSYQPGNNSYGNGYGDSGYGTGGGYYDDDSDNGYSYDDGGIASDRFRPGAGEGTPHPGLIPAARAVRPSEPSGETMIHSLIEAAVDAGVGLWGLVLLAAGAVVAIFTRGNGG